MQQHSLETANGLPTIQQLIDAEKHGYIRYLNTEPAAEILGLSPRTLERWRLEGKGPEYSKFGRRVTYSFTALLTWAENQTRTSTSEAK